MASVGVGGRFFIPIMKLLQQKTYFTIVITSNLIWTWLLFQSKVTKEHWACFNSQGLGFVWAANAFR